MGWSLNPSQVRQGDSELPPAPAPLSTVGCVLSGAGPGWGSVSLELGFSLSKCRCLRALALRPSLCRSTRTLQKSSGQCLHTQPVQGEAGAWGDSGWGCGEAWASGPRCGCPLTCLMGRGGLLRSGLLEPKSATRGNTLSVLGCMCTPAPWRLGSGAPIRYGKIPGSHADVEFSPFQSRPVMAGAVGLWRGLCLTGWPAGFTLPTAGAEHSQF